MCINSRVSTSLSSYGYYSSAQGTPRDYEVLPNEDFGTTNIVLGVAKQKYCKLWVERWGELNYIKKNLINYISVLSVVM